MVISPLIFSWGKADVGTSQPKKSHSGFHPCFTLYTSNLSGGTMDFTRWLCIRYRFLKTQVDLGFIEPSKAVRQQSTTSVIFLAVWDSFNFITALVVARTAWIIWSWFTQLCTQESSSRSLRINLQSGKTCNISSQVYPRPHQHSDILASHLAGCHFGKRQPSDPKNQVVVVESQRLWIQVVVKLRRLI